MTLHQPVQLYTLINELSLLVDNKDELGSISANVIIVTLISFTTQAGSRQEIQLEETAAVYQGLEDALDQCREKDSFQTLCDYSVKAHEFFKTFDGDVEKLSSPLLKHFMAMLKQKRGIPEDLLRRNGLALAKAVIDRGPLARKIDCLKDDYRMMETIFAT